VDHRIQIFELLGRHPKLWLVAGMLGLGLAVLSANRFFGGWRGFLEALRYKFQPGWLSAVRGEFWEDTKAEFKLGFWFLFSGLAVLGLKLGLTKVVVMFSLAERFNLPI
jgi:hypothetical protein